MILACIDYLATYLYNRAFEPLQRVNVTQNVDILANFDFES